MNANAHVGLIRRLPLWLAFIGLCCISTACASLSSRAPYLCPIPSLCPATTPSPAQSYLDSAIEAERLLQEVKDLASYRIASEKLRLALNQISGNLLSSDQQILFDRLTSVNRMAQIVLAAEQQSHVHLEQAEAFVSAATKSTGFEQLSQLESAREALRKIPSESFSYDKAQLLQQQLERLSPQVKREPENIPERSTNQSGEAVAPPRPALPPPASGTAEGDQPDALWDKPLF